MPARITWTAAMDATIRAMHAERASWAAIGMRVGVSETAARERGATLGLTTPHGYPRTAAPRPDGQRGRDPLPAGHPASWGLLSPDVWPGLMADHERLLQAARELATHLAVIDAALITAVERERPPMVSRTFEGQGG